MFLVLRVNLLFDTLSFKNKFPKSLKSVNILGKCFYKVKKMFYLLQEDSKFLAELFAQLTEESTEDQKRKELIMFLKEFCMFSQTLQPQSRESFFKASLCLQSYCAPTICLDTDEYFKNTCES